MHEIWSLGSKPYEGLTNTEVSRGGSRLLKRGAQPDLSSC